MWASLLAAGVEILKEAEKHHIGNDRTFRGKVDILGSVRAHKQERTLSRKRWGKRGLSVSVKDPRDS